MIKEQRILYVCTVPALECYSSGLISAAFLSKKINAYACIFLHGNDSRSIQQLMFHYGISEEKLDKIEFTHLSSSKFLRILSGGKYLSRVIDFAKLNQIDKIHFVSQDVMLDGHLSKFKSFEVYYTVHDLHAHEVKLNAFNRWKHYYFRIAKDKRLVQRIGNLVTNSLHQKKQLDYDYPNDNIQYHLMPSLVTPEIIIGNQEMHELKSLDEYILFFGRIELYKGLETLYSLFSTRAELKKYTLVIAGAGSIYFKRDRNNESNIVLINRFIDDAEINDLFIKAKVVVLPYLTSTQSAISSFAYHYKLPVIA
jgi:glycosyltransferase involved in cell wall biosynthesis